MKKKAPVPRKTMMMKMSPLAQRRTKAIPKKRRTKVTHTFPLVAVIHSKGIRVV